ncbi:MAG: hypothetical protein K2Q19_02240 [Rhodocyclaceae bacterium]|jgi:hypothetical protein|nr:hypothetical protein [Rhodocyclaceae bacterium]
MTDPINYEDDAKRKRLIAIRRHKVLAAERPGGEESATSLLLTASASLKHLHLVGAIPEEDWVALDFLARGIDEWVNGVDIEDALCIRKSTGRPKARKPLAILEYVLPVSLLLDAGLTLTEATQKIATENGVTVRTIERAWKLGGGMDGYARRKGMDTTDK